MVQPVASTGPHLHLLARHGISIHLRAALLGAHDFSYGMDARQIGSFCFQVKIKEIFLRPPPTVSLPEMNSNTRTFIGLSGNPTASLSPRVS